MNAVRYHVVAAALALLSAASLVSAQTCTISAANVAFGGIDPLSGAAVDVSSDIEVECSSLIPLDLTVGVCIYLDEGSGGSDGTTYRYMAQGADTLPFNLYKDAARTQIWGSTTAFPGSGALRVLVTMSGLIPVSGSLTVPVYGRVPGTVSDRPIGFYESVFAGGARARYSLTDNIACDGASGTEATDTFTSSATILNTCTVEADDLDFGSRGQLDAIIDASSQIRSSCSSGLPYAISLGPGGGTLVQRRMVHDSFPAEIVNYQLYVDATRTQVWGDGGSGTVTAGGTGSGSPQAISVYGRVPLQATPRPGDYHDTVVVTVSY